VRNKAATAPSKTDRAEPVGARPRLEGGTRISDQQLIELYLAGDTGAFDQLMAEHEDRIFAVCLRIMGNRETALDASQETFITLFRKAGQFKGESAFSTWLYRVAVNTCYDQLRKQKRRRAEPLPEDRDPTDPTSADQMGSVEIRSEIEEALASLPEEFRAAVILSDLEALPLSRVAAALDIPVGTVKSRVFRGRKLLAEALGNLRDGPEHPTDEP